MMKGKQEYQNFILKAANAFQLIEIGINYFVLISPDTTRQNNIKSILSLIKLKRKCPQKLIGSM